MKKIGLSLNPRSRTDEVCTSVSAACYQALKIVLNHGNGHLDSLIFEQPDLSILRKSNSIPSGKDEMHFCLPVMCITYYIRDPLATLSFLIDTANYEYMHKYNINFSIFEWGLPSWLKRTNCCPSQSALSASSIIMLLHQYHKIVAACSIEGERACTKSIRICRSALSNGNLTRNILRLTYKC